MSENLLIVLITYPLTAFLTWFFTRKKTTADVRATELESSAKICKMWRDLSEGMEKRFSEEIAELRNRNESLEKQVKEVLYENESLRKRVLEIEQENFKLTTQLKNLDKKSKKHEIS